MASGANGLLEGTALLVLIPVLESTVASVPSHVSKGWASVVAWAGLPAAMLLPAALGAFAAFGILAALLRFLSESLILKVRVAAEQRARLQMSQALLATDWSSYLALRHGDIHKAIVVEGAQIASGTAALFGGIGATMTAVFYFVTAAYVSPEMTVYTMAFGTLIGLGYYWAANRVRRHFDRMSVLLASLADQVADVFGYLKLFRASGATTSAGKRTETLFRDFADASFRGQIYTPMLRAFFEGGAVLFVALFLLWRVHWEHDSAAVALIFLAIFYRLAPRLMTAQEGFFQARSYLSWFDAWRNRLDYALAHRGPTSGTVPPAFGKALTLKEVRFQYPKSAAPVLDGVSITLRAGECLAVVGGSGGGKTTLIDLISGLLVPQGSSVVVDGVDLRDLDIEAWRHRLGIVMQDSPIFHTSILGNVAWGDSSPDRAKALECLRSAHALEFVEDLPEDVDTIVGEKGARLSGGQRQRIAIARALYRDPWLLILDEATSSLDGHSEAVVQEAIESLKGKTTILLVAHRLKTVRMADRIVVLKEGKIAEEGNWDELLQRRGVFHAMWAKQHIGGVDNE